MQKFGKNPTYYKKIVNNPDIISSFRVYNSDANIATELNTLIKDEALEFYNTFRSNEASWFSFVKEDPNRVRILNNYKNTYIYARVTNATEAEVLANYGAVPKQLFVKVENLWHQTKAINYSTQEGRTLLNKTVLQSGMVHIDYPELMPMRTNINDTLLKKFIESKGWSRKLESPNNMLDMNKIKEVYKEFEVGQYQQIHPWIYKKIETHIKIRLANKWKLGAEFDKHVTGHIPGVHAEVRALNQLLWDLEAKGVVINDEVIKKIYGYNKNYDDYIMPRCADCYFIIREVNMIKAN